MPTIREQIGEDLYLKLESEAEKEVALAMEFEIIDKYKQDRYYQKRSLLTPLLKEFFLFEEKGLKFTPVDIVNILFDAKLQRACQTEQEFIQRRGGAGTFQDAPFKFRWNEKATPIEDVIHSHLEGLTAVIKDRILASEISNFHTSPGLGDAKQFLQQLFGKISLPFDVEFNASAPTPADGRHQPETGKISFAIKGTESYVYFYAQAYLRTFLNLLRISGFLYRGQIDFGMWGIVMMAPTSPWFLNTNQISGAYSWNEDEKKPWEKIPDGCLFLSFGYRGITNLFLDNRTFSGIEKVYIENKIIFDNLKNPWSEKAINDIAPSLDILSSATQMPDLGAKILQIYCCLEHLFIPKDVRKDNIRYIIGAINVLDPKLIPWFERLYKIRCDYAHKGYVQKDEKTLSLVFESVQNTTKLLTAKLGQG